MRTKPRTLEEIIRNRKVRRKLSQESFYMFFYIYFSHYVKYATAPFQKEMFNLLEDEAHQTLVFVAFRGSGKSTIVTMAYVLWSILGKQQKKYVVIAGQTQWQARQHLQNIKAELERNPLLRNDLGPFQEESAEWGSFSLVLLNFEAKIAAASTEQSIRGTRYGAHRPDLIVCDDVEDLASVKTLEIRDKTFRWFTGEVLPSGDLDTRVIVVGNLLHEDSLIVRLKKSIEAGELTGLFREYPLLDDSGVSLWPGKFPDAVSIQTEKKKIGSRNAWMREYLLLIIPEDDQVVLAEWITYYDEMPSIDDLSYRYTIAAIDLAISESTSADYTAIPVARVFGYDKKMRIYILPHPINQRINFPQQLEVIKGLYLEHNKRITFLVEINGYQKVMLQTLEKEGYPVKGVQHSSDKRVRLSLITPQLKNGVVLFPRNGADILIRQLVGFKAEKHDDLADAFTMLIDYCVQKNGRSMSETLEEFARLNQRIKRSESLLYKQF